MCESQRAGLRRAPRAGANSPARTGSEDEPARARRRARRVPEPRSPRTYQACLRETGYRAATSRLTTSHPSWRRPSPRATTSGSRSSSSPPSGRWAARRCGAARVRGASSRHGGSDLPRAVGLRECGFPRASDRPRGKRAPLEVLPRVLGEPDDAGDARRQGRGSCKPRDRARENRRVVCTRGSSGRGVGDPNAIHTGAGSRSTQSSGRVATSDALTK